MKFECVHCGECCKQKGAFRFLKSDIERISSYLGLTFNGFCDKYKITNIQNQLYFMENFDCIFLDKNNKCIINEVKPFFCKNYIPFIDNLNSPIYKICQGLGHGKDWTDEEIKERYNTMINNLVIVKDGDA